jgi:hypothetical protein
MAATTTDTQSSFDSPKHHVRCADCGYGAVARALPDQCPVCRASSWEPDTWHPFGHLRDVWPGDETRPPSAAA